MNFQGNATGGLEGHESRINLMRHYDQMYDRLDNWFIERITCLDVGYRVIAAVFKEISLVCLRESMWVICKPRDFLFVCFCGFYGALPQYESYDAVDIVESVNKNGNKSVMKNMFIWIGAVGPFYSRLWYGTVTLPVAIINDRQNKQGIAVVQV